MRLYRMEDPDGNGPFSGNRCLWPLDYHPRSHELDFPTPNAEGLMMTPYHRCACKNPRQIVHWFPRPVRKFLAEHDMRVVVKEVPDELVQEGQYQVIYLENPDA